MGARTDAEWRRLRRFISGATLLPFDTASDFEGAAAIHWVGRQRGITVGKTDCLILAVAKRAGARFITHDPRQAELGRLVNVAVVAV
jgi:predicted nucleic acid-binding protein